MRTPFNLVSLDAREGLFRYNEYPAGWLFAQDMSDIIGLIAVPDSPLKGLPMCWPATQPNIGRSKGSPRDALQSCPQRTHKYMSQIGLSTLPADLIGMICDELCMGDLICLALAARKFWNLVRPYMEKDLMRGIAPWAGHRIICIGAVYPFDYPPGVLNEGEEKELSKGMDIEEVARYIKERFPPYPRYVTSLSDIIEWRYVELVYAPLKPQWEEVRNIALYQMREYPQPMRSKVLNFSRPRPTKEYHTVNKNWILRNLTTHEFIRSEVVAGNSKHHGPYIDDLGFEHIIILRTLWASSSSKRLVFNGRKVHRGVWAGHRLDIITFERHAKSRSSNATWTDISEEAIEDIIQVWRRPNCHVDRRTCES